MEALSLLQPGTQNTAPAWPHSCSGELQRRAALPALGCSGNGTCQHQSKDTFCLDSEYSPVRDPSAWNRQLQTVDCKIFRKGMVRGCVTEKLLLPKTRTKHCIAALPQT
ncbi:hypothetical protein Y1Q_0012665 [Alligator mississippiensis]|uniref:Uncharacterized protein n=1 Tax=Alligator mississippiensis TaxID=8496 RepID=A0A151M8J8_ALLMI|nr:hypothetical protein Y1Q_0012665 [Alligator mississippiensis]